MRDDSSTAVPADYALADVPATILAGHTEDYIQVYPVADDINEIDENLTLIVQSGALYGAGSPASATVVIRETPDLIDIDSDNTSRFAWPDGSDREERLELQKAGKLIIVNRDDDDGDGILDYADGFGAFDDTYDDDVTTGERFVPVVVRIPAGVPTQTTLEFEYDAADPASLYREEIVKNGLDGVTYISHNYWVGGGLLRLWKKHGDEPRGVSDYVAPYEQLSLSELEVSPGEELAFFLEAVNGSPVATSITVTLRVPEGATITQSVRVLPLDPLVGLSEPEVAGYRIIRGHGGSIVGSASNDIIIGSDYAQRIDGLGGDDVIIAGAGDDTIVGGDGSDLIFAFFANKEILIDDDDALSYIEGNVVRPAAPLQGRGVMGAMGADDPAQNFSAEDIIAAYQWMYGVNDIWYRGFKQVGGTVLAVAADGHWFSDWHVDMLTNGDQIRWNVKIEYDIGTVLDAAAALRAAILKKIAWSDGYQGFLMDIIGGGKADIQTFSDALLAYKELRERGIAYAARVTEVAANLYLAFLTLAPGGDIAEVICELPEFVAGTYNLLLELFSLFPGDNPNPDPEPIARAGDGELGFAFEEMALAVVGKAARAALKAAGLTRHCVTLDVVKPAHAALGFAWRRDLLAQGKTAAMKITPVVRNHRVTLIIGTAQAAGDGHAAAVIKHAQALANTGAFSHITLARSWRTATGRVGTSNLVPDIIAVCWDGKVMPFEVISPSNTPAALIERMQRGMNTLPARYHTRITEAMNILSPL